MSDIGSVHVGTSGWHYGHWEGPFYPQGMPKKDWLDFYAGQLQTVEINNTFYQLPEESTVDTWRETAPQGFMFAVKASRY
ncbi:MAG: DUF72 domain-containing protein, partial [Anaerolineae bacterium]|nr:DUF72 domain-containing protein [Anaerolineae bacterium]